MLEGDYRGKSLGHPKVIQSKCHCSSKSLSLHIQKPDFSAQILTQVKNIFIYYIVSYHIISVIAFTLKESHHHEDWLILSVEEVIVSFFYLGNLKEGELNPSDLMQSGNSHGTNALGG